MVAVRTRAVQSAGLDHRLVKWTFVVATFLGSSLLFLVQPMAARLILPVAGGSSAVWNTAMVFFQLTLLAAYVYSHVAARLSARPHVITQCLLLVIPLLLVLPIGLPSGWVLPAGSNISIWVLGTLLIIVGLPFFAVSTSSPTLQHWFAKTNHPDAADPYFLYAAGNVGSVLALVAYPLAVEPLLTLGQQGVFWAVVYGGFVASSVIAGVTILWGARGSTGTAVDLDTDGFEAADSGLGLANRRSGPSGVSTESFVSTIPWSRRLTWIGWSAVPSALLLGVTNYITTDLASFPLLWIVPLMGYLLSFVLVFGSDAQRLVKWARIAVLGGGIPLALVVLFGYRWLVISIGVQLAWFFAAAVLCHGRLASDRPSAGRLTEFYVAMSVGGALGGTLTVLLAPLIFSSVAEYPIAIALVFLIVPTSAERHLPLPIRLPAWSTIAAVAATAVAAVLVPGLAAVMLMISALVAAASLSTMRAIAIAVACLLLLPQFIRHNESLYSSRTAFGVYRVTDLDEFRTLVVGTTSHGTEQISRMDDPVATSYYHANGPVGQVMRAVEDRTEVGVIGLGTGSLAVWGRSGDMYRFFEIDGEVVDIATNPDFFTFLATSDAEVEIEVVDGRLGVARSGQRFDLLVVDAFSSDAIPIHLLTVEAVETYLAHLEPDGIILFNISNRHFDLEPVLGRLAEHLGLTGRVQSHTPTAEEESEGAVPSLWAVLSRSPSAIETASGSGFGAADGGWEPLRTDSSLWTDDYSFVIGALIW